MPFHFLLLPLFDTKGVQERVLPDFPLTLSPLTQNIKWQLNR